MRLEPRPGEKIWMVSSMQAAASPNSSGAVTCSRQEILLHRPVRKKPRAVNSEKWASFRRTNCPLSPNTANRSETTLKIPPLISPDISPGTKELPQMKARFRITKHRYNAKCFRRCFFSITESPDAPAESSRPAGSESRRRRSPPSFHICSRTRSQPSRQWRRAQRWWHQ